MSKYRPVCIKQSCDCRMLQLWTEFNQCFALFGVAEVLEVLDEGSSQCFSVFSVCSLVSPTVFWVEDAVVHTGNVFWNIEVEWFYEFGFAVQQFAIEDSGDDGTCSLQGDTFAYAVAAAGPTGVNQVCRCIVLVEFLSQLFCIFCRVQS